MTAAKLSLTLGSLSFSGEGEEKWLAAQLDKVIHSSKAIAATASAPAASLANATSEPRSGSTLGKFTEPLAAHIKAKGGESNQVKRFLATADWLRLRGATTLTASIVGKAILDNHQKRLANPADSLNKNITKGFCEKVGDGFYVTPHGLKELGHPD